MSIKELTSSALSFFFIKNMEVIQNKLRYEIWLRSGKNM